jgi:arsenate reductase
MEMQRVLFVCIGNSCRSQMAEGFARAYGKDVMIAASAGVAPAMVVAADTHRAMEEKNISLADHFPKSVQQLRNVRFDLIVNMSGVDLADFAGTPTRIWTVRDPIGTKYETHCEIRDEIESAVMELILQMRREQKTKTASSVSASSQKT